jgi:putative oxidoreductase
MTPKPLRTLFDRVTVNVFDRLRDPTLLLVRVVQGWLFFKTGTGKLGNLDGTTEFFAGLGLPMPGAHAVAIGALECAGGLLLLAGCSSRLVALLLFGNMAVAYLIAHRDAFASAADFAAAAPYPFLLASLLVLAFGPGRWSFDGWRQRRAERAAAVAAPVRHQTA